MATWKDDAIDQALTPVIEIVIEEIDPDFSRLDLVASFQKDVIAYSYRVRDRNGQRVKVSLSNNIFNRGDEIKNLLTRFRQSFVDNNEAWAAMHVRVTDTGDFEMEFDYKDPYKFDIQKM